VEGGDVKRGREGRKIGRGGMETGPGGLCAVLALGLALVLAAPGPARADGPVSFSGYFKSFSILAVPPRITAGGTTMDQPDMGAVDNRLRLKLAIRPAKALSFDIAYDFSPRIQDARLFGGSLFFPGEALGGYRLADLRGRLYPGPGATPESFAIYQNLDRLSLTLKTGFADIIVGRQAVAWGSARVVNPTDILAPFAFNELDKEERTGVDAVRVRVPLGSMDELDMGAVAGDRFSARTSAFFLRGKVHTLKTDISAMAMAFRDHLMLGLDLARSVGGAGTWLEAAYVIPEAFLESASGEKDYFRVSAGVDYNFSSKVYGFTEYHFNSAGARGPESYLALFRTTAYRDGADYLLGRHYLSVGSTWQASALIPVTGLLIVNLGDPSLIAAPSLDYNISQNIYLGGGAYLGIGRRPEFTGFLTTPPAGPDLLHSEFGSYPRVVYLSFRVYF
jgi:hypothetical protein